MTDSPQLDIGQSPGTAPRQAKQSEASRGTKRQRTDLEEEYTNGDHFQIHANLTPRTLSPHSATDTSSPDEIKYFDDEHHPEYEWVRLPKKRAYHLYKFIHSKPQDRNSAEAPLTVTMPDGTDATMWAKLDTGADYNVINLSTARSIYGEDADKHIRPGANVELIAMGGNDFRPKHHVYLKFRAGLHPHPFERVYFLVYDDSDVPDPDKDGLPNVILGLPFLRSNSMVMIDLEYSHPADPDLPVIAKRAKDEDAHVAAILIGRSQIRVMAHGPSSGYVPKHPPR